MWPPLPAVPPLPSYRTTRERKQTEKREFCEKSNSAVSNNSSKSRTRNWWKARPTDTARVPCRISRIVSTGQEAAVAGRTASLITQKIKENISLSLDAGGESSRIAASMETTADTDMEKTAQTDTDQTRKPKNHKPKQAHIMKKQRDWRMNTAKQRRNWKKRTKQKSATSEKKSKPWKQNVRQKWTN